MYSKKNLILIFSGIAGAIGGVLAYRASKSAAAQQGISPRESTISRTAEVRRLEPRHATEAVEAASEDSFPASDAPAWTGTGV